jgi:hypothetical protein
MLAVFLFATVLATAVNADFAQRMSVVDVSLAI